MTAETKPRVAIYSRVSSEEQAAEGVSIEAQAAALKAYAKSMSWEIFDEYVDGGYSGGTDDRPAFRRMLLDAREKRFNIIAVCKLDRFFRNLRLLLDYLYELQLGIKFITTQEGLDTSNQFGKFALQMMGVIAEFERGRIGERVRDARHYLISQGNWAGGRPPYGYRWLRDEKKWEIVEEEADIVRRIFRMYVEENGSIEGIAKTLNSEGSLTRDGSAWRFSTVRLILTHPGYKGEHQVGISMPPLVDGTTWQRAQDRREEARSLLRDPNKGWLLQGLVSCGECGLGLKCVQKRNTEQRYYACRGRIERKLHRDEDSRCKLPYIRADKLESAVWTRIKDILSDREKLSDCVNRAIEDLEAQKTRVGADALAIAAKLETIRARKERLSIAFADGTVNESLYKEMLAALKKQETNLLKNRHDIDPSRMDSLAALEARIKAIKEFLAKGDLVLDEFGIYAVTDHHYLPIGFNAFRESDGKIALGKIEPKQIMVFEGENPIYMWGVIDPPAFYECEDSKKRIGEVVRNIRAVIQLFDIKVFVYSDRVEIKGAIPPQLLGMNNVKEASPAPVISLGRGTQGVDFK